MTLKQLREFCSQWQHILRLQEWDIKIRWMTKAECESDFGDCNGFCHWNAQYKNAHIVIAKNSESIPFTVIHELLHIRFEGHSECVGGTDIPQEVTINAITAAFMEFVPDLADEIARLKESS